MKLKDLVIDHDYYASGKTMVIVSTKKKGGANEIK